MRLRYDIIQIWTDPWGRAFYEVVDLKTGVVFWTKQVQAKGRA